MIILLVHKITGYGTINKINTLQKYKLIMWLTDRTGRVGRYLSVVDYEGKRSGVVAVIAVIFSQ